MSEETRMPGRDETPRDEELRAGFAAVRRELEASGRVPDFQGMMAEARAAEDVDLAADFSSLRESVGASDRVPDFASMLGRARAEAGARAEGDGAAEAGGRTSVTRLPAERSSERARADLVRLGRWIPIAAAAAVAGLLWIGGPDVGGDDEFERLVADYSSSAASWRSPTASLMDIPGVDLGAVPSVGTSLGGLADTDVPEGRDS